MNQKMIEMLLAAIGFKPEDFKTMVGGALDKVAAFDARITATQALLARVETKLDILLLHSGADIEAINKTMELSAPRQELIAPSVSYKGEA